MPDAPTTFWPPPDERRLLGRFYAAATLGETLNVVFPFQFAYFFLVMDRPEWAVIPVLVASATVLLVEIPTGLVADRLGRKASVVAGYFLTALSWGLIPTAVALPGIGQLWAASGCFALGGLGQTLISGAYESWVVDNLRSRQRPELVDAFFARETSFTAAGGVLAGLGALAILLATEVDRWLLDTLWYLAAAGLLLAGLVLTRVPERSDDTPEVGDRTGWRVAEHLQVLLRRPALLLFATALAVATFSGSVADEALDISLLTKGMDARGFAPLGIAEDLVGILAPVAGLALARRWGATPVLVGFIAASAALTLLFFAEPGWPIVFALYLLFAAADQVWDPVAEAKLHQLIPSATRATTVSVVNQIAGLAELAGFAALAWLLGEHSDALRSATPDLVAAFRGNPATPEDVPVGWLDLPVPDLAVVLFIASGLLAIPFLLYSHSRTTQDTPS